eukprot:1157851-Prymnesium_polylepis.1
MFNHTDDNNAMLEPPKLHTSPPGSPPTRTLDTTAAPLTYDTTPTYTTSTPTSIRTTRGDTISLSRPHCKTRRSRRHPDGTSQYARPPRHHGTPPVCTHTARTAHACDDHPSLRTGRERHPPAARLHRAQRLSLAGGAARAPLEVARAEGDVARLAAEQRLGLVLLGEHARDEPLPPATFGWDGCET